MASSPLFSSRHPFRLHSFFNFTRRPMFSPFPFSQAPNMTDKIPHREISPSSLSSLRCAGMVEEERSPEQAYKNSKKLRSNSKSFQRESEKAHGKGDKVSSFTEVEFRRKLDMCSRAGDLMGALSLYDSALKEGFIKLGQYHYSVLLYLCSSAAMGFIHPAKSGRTTGDSGDSDEDDRINERVDSRVPIKVSDDVRDYARSRGLEIYERISSQKIPMTEAALTSVARIAMSMGNGDMAFETVKQMKKLGISPRLRSYGPAIFAFCNSGNVEKAFEVEKHMSESGIAPEEPELEALLRASVKARKGGKVYYLLHRLRTNVRQVSPSCADTIEAWFKSSTASRVGKRKWDEKMIEQAMQSGGGGWHRLGWFGKGKWTVLRTNVNAHGVCEGCGEKLITIDIDPIETEKFAKSVASMAKKRERNSSFQKFQRWLDYYGPFEAVVDAANVGLFSQREFSLIKVNAVVNAVRQKLPSKKWPLIIVHNKRLLGRKMGQPLNQKIIEKWKNADALYPTPTGSNDDWYWLYAAIKCKCLIVTNDEMRDHLFQILGNDFFHKWKERHQVHFSFRDGNFEFLMPPPCSVVIQESATGNWHIPLLEEHDSGKKQMWLCVTRGRSSVAPQISTSHKEGRSMKIRGALEAQASSRRRQQQQQQQCQSSTKYVNKKSNRSFSRQLPRSFRAIDGIEAAENISGCTIDFQI